MKNPYKTCPIYENDTYLLRFVEITDANDLLAVYSDEKSVPFLTVIIAAVMIFITQRLSA